MNSVLIAGAGPTGLTLAIELARFGIPVRIVDKAPERTTKSKALVVWTRTLELLERSGCAERFLTLGNPVTAASIFAGKKRVGRITFDDVVSPYPFALMIPQSETERILENHLNFLGVHVERGVALADFASIDSKVTATLVHPNDRREVHVAPYLVGCDGAHSFVRDRLGIDFAGDTMPSDWILADVHLTGVTTPASELDLIWHEDGVFALFPMAENRYRVIADVGLAHADVPRPNPTLAEVQAIVDRRGPGGIRVSDPKWLASFRINERKVAAYRFGRVFLAGDAAHIHSPAGGQGMNTGMQDAINLAWKLALVARDTCAPEPLLASYSAERSAVGKQLLAATGTLTAVAVTKNPVARYFRNHAAEILFGLASAREKIAEALTEVSIGYPHSPLNREIGAHPGLRAGSRAPLRANEIGIGSGDIPRFAIFASPSDNMHAPLSGVANLIEPEPRAPIDGNGITLVRPDGYVALTAPAGEWHAVATYLGELRE